MARIFAPWLPLLLPGLTLVAAAGGEGGEREDALALQAGADLQAGLYPDAAAAFDRLLALCPGATDALIGAGWSALALGDAAGAAGRFERALAGSPASPGAWAGLQACRSRVPELADLRADGPVRPFYSLLSVASRLTYGGQSARRDGTALDVVARGGWVGRGWVDVALSRVDIDTVAGVPSFRQDDLRLGGGFLPTPEWIVRGRVGWTALDDTPPAGQEAPVDPRGWTYAAGATWLRSLVWQPGLDLFRVNVPDAGIWQVRPSLAWNTRRFGARIAVTAQQIDWDRQAARSAVFVEPSVSGSLTDSARLSAGVGFGESYYGLGGFADVFYGLADRRTDTAWVQYGLDLRPYVLMLRAQYDRYVADGGDVHHGFCCGVGLGAYFDGVPRLTPSPAAPPVWSLAGGAERRGVGVGVRPAAPAPLVTRVVAPIPVGAAKLYDGSAHPLTYEDGILFTPSDWPRTDEGLAAFEVSDLRQWTDRGAEYGTVRFQSRTLSYSLENQPEDVEASTSDEGAVPWLTVRRRLSGEGGPWALHLAGTYALASAHLDTGWRDALFQDVVENEATRTFTYATYTEPLNGIAWVIFDPEAFDNQNSPSSPAPAPTVRDSSRTRVYERYTGRVRSELSAGVHFLSLAAEAEWIPSDRWQVGVSAGPALAAVDWTLTDSTRWTDSAGTILAGSLARDSGVAWVPGAEARLALRWAPVAKSRFFLELHGGYSWYDRPAVRANDGTRVAFELSGYEAGLGVGCR